MVEGLDRFAAHFSGFTDQYALIGGAVSRADVGRHSVQHDGTYPVD